MDVNLNRDVLAGATLYQRIITLQCPGDRKLRDPPPTSDVSSSPFVASYKFSLGKVLLELSLNFGDGLAGQAAAVMG